MKAHVLTPQASHRRASPRRVSARHGTTGTAHRGPRSARHGVEVSPARTYTAPVCTATGFLIPRLSPAVPLGYEGQVPGGLAHIQALVTCGALTLTSEGATADALIETGIDSLTPPGLKAYENQWGELFSVRVREDGIGFSVECDPHSWKMRLRPIIDRLTSVEAAAFITTLNASQLQGPWWWDEMIGFASGEIEDEAEETAREARDHCPGSEALRVQAEQRSSAAADWLKKLFVTHTALREHVSAIVCARRKADKGLRALIARFTAACLAVDQAKIKGDTALMVTTWSKDCYLNHAHDFHCQQIHRGDWDVPGPVFDHLCKDIPDFIRTTNIVGEFIAAAQALEEWTNAHD